MLKPWMVIGGIALVLAIAISAIVPPGGAKWFRRLRRPQWLTFEAAIPVIWTTVFVCGAISATIVWNNNPDTTQTWILMGLYLLLEIVTLLYSPVMLLTRNLTVGTVIGGTGFILAIVLAIAVFPISGWATLLLVPYLLWSPIGTYTTWAMKRLNPMDG